MAEKKRPPTSGTRKGNGAGLWGEANGMGWGGQSQGNGQAPRAMTPEERDALRCELVALYVTISRDSAQPAMLRMAAASKLLERLDNPFSAL